MIGGRRKGSPPMKMDAHHFNLELPLEMWERFKQRAIDEYGSPRQAALALIREYLSRPKRLPTGDPDATDK